MLRSVLRIASSQCSSLLFSSRIAATPASLKIQNYSTSEEKVEESSEKTASPENVWSEADFGQTFPNKDTASMLINDVPFCELPIIHIKATSNNTILSVTDHKGVVMYSETCGTVGFRNVKKGTNIAAQAAAISIAQKLARGKGIRVVRINVKGFGAGRLASMTGFKMAGVTMVSITDSTKLPHCGNKPKRKRRI
ncbi:hypothetical protein LOTGIDRAFT_233001 [Lottia gigantea]|uniref:Ribosomal protein S11 n=1 Tax=Lottia gigantea TaxID=225164 RepID=V4A731_LOTGI|nr:hypothetical protein LOTGIDRAFT_233001 [Lottia gigantea]ESO92532.1 hypothetical protein LOTGIDRAFT_233001 [Lottia gigantea]